jgi:hypothetical protein
MPMRIARWRRSSQKWASESEAITEWKAVVHSEPDRAEVLTTSARHLE